MIMYKGRQRVCEGTPQNPGGSNPEAALTYTQNEYIRNFKDYGRVHLIFRGKHFQVALYDMYEYKHGIDGKKLGTVEYANSRWSLNNEELTIETGSEYLVRV